MAAPPSPLPLSSRDWHRRVWRLAGPIILSNLSVPLVGAVDTAVVGHLSDPVYIGAVALGSILFNFLFWGFGFLRMGTTGFIAQAHGAGDSVEVRTTLVRALLLAGGLGLAVIVLQYPIARAAFWALQGSQQLENLAHEYYLVRVWSAPATLIPHKLSKTELCQVFIWRWWIRFRWPFFAHALDYPEILIFRRRKVFHRVIG